MFGIITNMTNIYFRPTKGTLTTDILSKISDLGHSECNISRLKDKLFNEKVGDKNYLQGMSDSNRFKFAMTDAENEANAYLEKVKDTQDYFGTGFNLTLSNNSEYAYWFEFCVTNRNASDVEIKYLIDKILEICKTNGVEIEIISRQYVADFLGVKLE